MLPTRHFAAPLIAAALLATGCEIQPEAVPADAAIVSEGANDLRYTASSRGTIYVHEKNSDRLLYSGKVEAGDVVRLDRDRQRLTIDNQTVLERDLRGVGDYVIRFEPADSTRRTVILRDRRYD